ncbi:MAG: hypothetical protein J7M21_00175, partial [Planctomycetes bacterium]|nr:hypothetical protein [Planctomycetota bacterium]
GHRGRREGVVGIEFHLAGGKLVLSGTDIHSFEGLAASWFQSGGLGSSWINFEGPYTDNKDGQTFTAPAGTGNLMERTPDDRAVLDQEFNIPNYSWDGVFPGHGGNQNNFQALFTGQFTATKGDGTYNFQGLVDDNGTLYIDKNQDGVFTADEQVLTCTYNTTGSGAVDLVGGQTYNVAFGTREAGGGDHAWYKVQWPGAADYAYVDPTAADQAGMWSYMDAGSGNYGNDIVALAGTTTAIENTSGFTANVGAMTLQHDATVNLQAGSGLNTTGITMQPGSALNADAAITTAAMTINATAANGTSLRIADVLTSGSTTLAGDAGRTVTIQVDAGGQPSLGTMDDTGVALTIAKTGAGRLSVTDTGNSLSDTTFQVIDGQLRVRGGLTAAEATARGADYELAGGTLYVQAGGAVNGVQGRYFNTNGGSWTTNWDYSLPADVTKVETAIDFQSAVSWGLTDFFGQPKTDQVAGQWTGYFVFDQDANVQFGINADDGSVFFLDGQQVVSRDGPHGMAGNMATSDAQFSPFMLVTKGVHTFEMRQIENAGAEGAELWWDLGSGNEKVPAGAYYLLPPAPLVDLTDSNVAVTADSTIDVDFGSVIFNEMTMAAGTTLTVLPTKPVGQDLFVQLAGGTTFAGDANFLTTGTIKLGAVTVPAGGWTLKSLDGSTGTVEFNDTASGAGIDSDALLWIVGGTVAGYYDANGSSIGQAKAQLDGGTLSLTNLAGGSAPFNTPIEATWDSGIAVTGDNTVGNVLISAPDDAGDDFLVLNVSGAGTLRIPRLEVADTDSDAGTVTSLYANVAEGTDVFIDTYLDDTFATDVVKDEGGRLIFANPAGGSDDLATYVRVKAGS